MTRAPPKPAANEVHSLPNYVERSPCWQTIVHCVGERFRREITSRMETEFATPARNRRTHMKRYLVLSAIAVMALGTTSAQGQAVSSLESLKNRAVVASPRAQEVFPFLARQAPRATPQVAVSSEVNNRALLASPRTLETFPGLARTFRGKTVTGSSELTEAFSNSAILASPRTLEQFPSLSRDRSLDRVITRGGASGLMTPGPISGECLCAS